jgi:preprotein translocase subunit SecA
MDHLHNMDVLREGIGLRAWGQRDPLIEYKKEAFGMFKGMIHHIYQEACHVISRAVIMEEPVPPKYSLPQMNKPQLRRGKTNANMSTHDTKNIGRNDPCHCGSGKKFKKCCMN